MMYEYIDSYIDDKFKIFLNKFIILGYCAFNDLMIKIKKKIIE